MAKFNEYAQKATPEDNDTLMIYDNTSKANKLSPFSGIWNWIVGKLTNAVIANLQTNNKTVLGAINELNSNRLFAYVGKMIFDENGTNFTSSIISETSIKNVVSVKAYDPNGEKTIHTELYSYSTVAYIRVTDDNGNRIKNAELDIVIFYTK